MPLLNVVNKRAGELLNLIFCRIILTKNIGDKMRKNVMVLIIGLFLVSYAEGEQIKKSEYTNQIMQFEEKISTAVENNNKDASNQEKLSKLMVESIGIENKWNINPGIYYIKEVRVECPELQDLKYWGFKDIIVVDKNKICIFDPANFENRSNYFTLLTGEKIKDDYSVNLDNDDAYFPVFMSERSAGGNYQVIVPETNSITVISWDYSAPFYQQISCQLTNKNIVIPTTLYDIKFPWYAIIEHCDVYESSDISSKIIFRVDGCQLDNDGLLTQEGVENIVTLTDIKINNDIIMYKIIYKEKKGWITSDSIPFRGVYRSKDDAIQKFVFDIGL
jgi:hypothetical protein